MSVVCPDCGSKDWRNVSRSPVDPADDVFECTACTKKFGRYDPPSADGALLTMIERWKLSVVWNVRAKQWQVGPSGTPDLYAQSDTLRDALLVARAVCTRMEQTEAS